MQAMDFMLQDQVMVTRILDIIVKVALMEKLKMIAVYVILERIAHTGI